MGSSTGFATTCALDALGCVLATVLYLSYKWDNTRRDALHGRPDLDAPVDTTELADKVSLFVFERPCRAWLTVGPT